MSLVWGEGEKGDVEGQRGTLLRLQECWGSRALRCLPKRLYVHALKDLEAPLTQQAGCSFKASPGMHTGLVKQQDMQPMHGWLLQSNTRRFGVLCQEADCVFAAVICLFAACMALCVCVTGRRYMFVCVACGLWGGLFIGLQTEYFTSNRYRPVQVCGSRGGVGLCVLWGE